MSKIRVGVIGACGKMGKEVVEAVLGAENMELVCAIDIFGVGSEAALNVKIENDLEHAISEAKPDVLVDFTQPASIYANAQICISKGVRPVIGTTGLSDEQLMRLEDMAKKAKLGCVVAPNFSTGAVLMMKFSQMAAKHFDNAEIIELHHNQKKDAPSGTAIKTAQMMSDVKKTYSKGNCPEVETLTGARGGNCCSDIRIHSVRMPGYIASQEVIFGSSGQIFKIRHDSMDRKCYMGGVLLSIEHVMKNAEFIYGLENILF